MVSGAGGDGVSGPATEGVPLVGSSPLATTLLSWLPGQRWFAGKGRVIRGADVTSDVEIAPRVRHVLLEVSYESGPPDRYQIPILVLDDASAEREYARIGPLGSQMLYDALHDHEGTTTLLRMIRGGRRVGELSAEAFTELDDLSGLPLGHEQSNTSIVYGDAYILKVFRRVSPGTNPDLEITRALAEAGNAHIAPPLGYIAGRVDGEPATFAVLSRFFRSGTEGWKLALASVRDLYAEADLHADEVGGDFAAEAERLGAATAEVHAALAAVLPTGEWGADDVARLASGMRARWAAAADEVDVLRPYDVAVQAIYDRLARYDRPIRVHRIHGDYHLGQVLRTDSGWVLLDFEGEPARPLAERTALESPLRDVAGMLRSFDYAPGFLLLDRLDVTALTYRAEEWSERNRAAFCDGYAAASGADPRGEADLLRAFELDKAVYEVMYEARHRPSWMTIPLGGISRLTGEPGPHFPRPASRAGGVG